MTQPDQTNAWEDLSKTVELPVAEVDPSTPTPSTMNLRAAILAILPALEQFTAFQPPEVVAAQREEWTAKLDEPLPQTGSSSDAVLSLLSEVVIPNGLRVGYPGFSGWMSIMPAALPAASVLAATVAGPQRWWVQSFNTLEDLAQRWLAELLGLPRTFQGLFTSGGALANLVALTAARQYAAERIGVDASQQGIAELTNARFYATTQTHHVVIRAISTLGFGRQAVVMIPTDAGYRMDVAALQDQLRRDRTDGFLPLAVLATAGTTNTGAIDPLPEITELCQDEDLWLHIDGAYGLLGKLDPRVASLYGDLSKANSLVLDPHKWLNVPIGCGAVFVRDRALLHRTFALGTAAYLDDEHNEMDSTPLGSQFADYGHQFHEIGLELSAPPRGIQVWAVLKEIGAAGVATRVQHNISQAYHLATLVNRSPVLELVAAPTLSICCFRYIPPVLRSSEGDSNQELLNQLNRDILYRIQTRGYCIPSGTTLDGKFTIRPCYLNPRSTETTVEMLVHEAELCGAAAWEIAQSQD
ncbi:MAG: pyridoxal phosphate-dependent decarboxylase family protein [Ktedonobacterales bacterium]